MTGSHINDTHPLRIFKDEREKSVENNTQRWNGYRKSLRQKRGSVHYITGMMCMYILTVAECPLGAYWFLHKGPRYGQHSGDQKHIENSQAYWKTLKQSCPNQVNATMVNKKMIHSCFTIHPITYTFFKSWKEADYILPHRDPRSLFLLIQIGYLRLLSIY